MHIISFKVQKDVKEEIDEEIEHLAKPNEPLRMAPAKRELTAEQSAFLEKRKRLRIAQQAKEEEENYVSIDLFKSQPSLGIFDKAKLEQNESVPMLELKTWKKCRDREMKILSSPAPKNFLEEMAVKTEQGILWKFPIDNEQGIDENKVL